MKTGIVFNIQHYAIHDGPGIRVTVFLKGCPLSCWWCHNPESQRLEPEPIQEEQVGTTMTVAEVMAEIEKDVVFFDESGGGVTFSGGEPLMQPEFLNTLLEECKRQEIHTALDTCGYATPEVFNSIVDHVDLFLFDLKIIDDTLHRQYTGVSTRVILENLCTLSERGKPAWIRFPVIPNITNTEKNLIDILEFLDDIKDSIHQVNLLPHHRTAEGKYQKLQRENKMAGVMPPSEEALNALKEQFEHHGFKTKIGG